MVAKVITALLFAVVFGLLGLSVWLFWVTWVA